MSTQMQTDFARRLHDLIEQGIRDGSPPEDVFEELLSQANSTFGHYNLEYVLTRETRR